MMKSCMDKVLASLILIFLIPFLIIVCTLILVKDGRPFFFAQHRVGKGNKIFKIWKLRTMRLQNKNYFSSWRDENDGDRITNFGSVLRQSSIDELPQLVNVLLGDISIVGPRPLLPEYLTLYTPAQARRHEVKPGITGWAQINGRNNISWEKKFELDVWYVDNQSFLLDIKIILITIRKVIFREGVSAKGEATMSKFRGSKN
ncbi:sugar transferase [Alphaproteobacteria bacterium]|nr:sugar transferase [Alphaproteobacteria bacterium]